MSYIGYIPKPIRHNVHLSPRDKLLYCEITACLDDSGICVKNNAYFAKVAGCTKSTVSASMTKLREFGYISVVIEKDEDSQKFKKRYITLKAVSDLQGGGNEELKKAISDSQGGVRGILDTSSEGGDAKAMSDTDEPIIINNNIRYISTSKKDAEILNMAINEKQELYLRGIVESFYKEKKRQFPHLKVDNDMIIGSINVLYDLITKDGWGEKVVRNVIRWAIDEKFWRNNLLSLRTLRKKSANEQTKFANLYVKYNEI